MKGRLFLTIFLLSQLFINCKKEGTGVVSKTVQTPEDTFKVAIDLQATEKDTFALYYTTDGSIDFTKKPPIWLPVEGKPSVQTVVFKFPQEIVPKQIRLDLGRNPEQQNIFLKKIRLSYHSKIFEAPGTLIFSYFRPDLKKTRIDAGKGMVSGIIKDGVRQSPSLYPKENPLGEAIEKLTEQ